MSKFYFIQTLCREPYRLFFPLGIVFGMVGVGHWLFYSLGLQGHYSSLTHASIQMQGYILCFVFGFLMTSIPRFSGTPHATGIEILAVLVSLLGVMVFSSFQMWRLAGVAFLGVMVVLLAFAGRRFGKRRGEGGSPPLEFIWIFFAMILALTGSLFRISSQLYPFSKPMLEQGFILPIVLGVGGFLAPRLMGLYRPTVEVVCEGLEGMGKSKCKLRYFHLLFGCALVFSFFLEGMGWKSFAYGLRAVVVTVVMAWTRAWPLKPRSRDFYILLLWISMGMVVCGYWGTFIFPTFRIEMLHLVFLGGFSLMTFAIATMVVLSHAGEAMELRKPLWILKVVLVSVLLSLVLRITARFFLGMYFYFVGGASVVWLVGALLWLCFILPRVFKVPPPQTFEAFHERVKKELS